uniref:Uncharacterized protein n=1 Tax=viral metagenome TaxID=1070528 RepID=A0A6C0DRE2_9ZZZZ
MDQIRKMVDEGIILNFDACVQNSRVKALVPDQSPAGSNTRNGLCAPFYKTGSWRGGISPGVDDRKDTIQSEWTQERTNQFTAIREQIVSNFNNAVTTINSRTAAAALDYPGAANEIAQAKQTAVNSISRLAAEGTQIGTFVTSMQQSQSGELMMNVAEKEAAIRKMEHENKAYRFQEEASKERTEGVYNKYEGNQHDVVFSYAPFEVSWSAWYSWAPYNPYVNLNPMSRSGLLFLAFFFGFLAVMAIGVKAFTTYTKFAATAGIMFNPPTFFSNPFKQPSLASRASALLPGRRAPDIFRY